MACTDCNPSSANWNQCFTVVNVPTDVIGGFNTLIGQICTVKGIAENAAVLPTFNTIGSCLPSPSATDTLVNTVNKLVVRTCQSPTYNVSNISWQCVSQPSNSSIEAGMQNIINLLSTTSKNTPTSWSGDFIISLTDPSNPCSGKSVSLATPINSDRLVASDPADSSPGTLVEKITAGTNITLDNTTTPGQLIITAAGGNGDHKVLVDSTDSAPGYLDQKINPLSSLITITSTYNSGTGQLDLGTSFDPSALFTALLNQLSVDGTLSSLFCSQVASCPSNCNPPTNLQAIVV